MLSKSTMNHKQKERNTTNEFTNKHTHTRFVSYELCVRFSYVALDADADAYT